MTRFFVRAAFRAAAALAVLAFLPALSAADALVLAKDASGHITNSSLSLSLTARPGCDETGALIPDGSRFQTDSFSMSLDDRGRGLFRGSGAILAADGRAILHATIHGFAGFGAPCTATGCGSPGHLEGWLVPVPTLGFRAATSVVEVHFSADLIAEAAGPVPLYRARLDGYVVPAPDDPPGDEVVLASELLAYRVDQPVVAIVKNGSATPIDALDGESYCTIVRLERETETGWELTAGCLLARMPLPVRIDAGEAVRVSLPPENTTPATKRPGVYRLSLTYLTPSATDAASTVRHQVRSQPFKVYDDSPPPPPSSGPVTLTTDRAGYRPGETILATVTNGSELVLEASDYQSFCTILSLQRRDADGWTPVGVCNTLVPTKPVRIDPRSSLQIPLPALAPGAETLPNGTYRLVLDGHLLDAAGAAVQPPVHVESAPFTVYATRTRSEGKG